MKRPSAFPLNRCGDRRDAAVAPGRDVTSGAGEAEWCSEGQTKGGAGGARRPAAGLGGGGPGLLAGRLRAASPGEWVGWGLRPPPHALSPHGTYSDARSAPSSSGALVARGRRPPRPCARLRSALPPAGAGSDSTLQAVQRHASPLPGTLFSARASHPSFRRTPQAALAALVPQIRAPLRTRPLPRGSTRAFS